MEATQSFRLIGHTDIVEVPCDQLDGQNIIYWEDIEQLFPGLQHVKHGNLAVKMLRDSNRNRIEPHCIKQYPGVVLDVVSSATAENGATADLYQRKSLEAEVDQRLVSALPLDIQAQVLASSNINDSIVMALKSGQVDQSSERLIACIRELKDEMAKINELVSKNNNVEVKTRMVNLQEAFDTKQTTFGTTQEEMKQIQIQALNQLVLLQNRVQALMTQAHDLHVHPIPRLFVVLPQDSSSWDPINLFSNKFRLYFLCECGEHTKAPNTKISHHIHFAKHDGYDILRPEEFFHLYGSYVLTILWMLKFGVSVPGMTVPPLSQLNRPDTLKQPTGGAKALTDSIELGIDQVIDCIEKSSVDKGEYIVGLSGQMGNNEIMESMDTHNLETFLDKDGTKVLGNLYRTVTAERQVKWVCIDHYRENHKEKAAKAFRELVESMGGLYEENIGSVKLQIPTKAQAEEVYLALERMASVHDLRIALQWDTTHGDFKRLRDTLLKTNVGVLELELNYHDGSIGDILNRGKRYSPILDIMRQSSIQSVAVIDPPKDFIQQSCLLSRNDGFLNLRHLDIGLLKLGWDIPGVKNLIAKSPNLASLILRRAEDKLPQVYSAIVEYQTYPINFTIPTLCILPPTSESRQTLVRLRDMAHLFEIHGERIEKLELSGKEQDEPLMDGMVKGTERGSKLKEFALKGDGRKLSSGCIKNLATVVSRSELRKLDLHLKEDRERVHILESIQWQHIRDLTIRTDQETLQTNAMKALVEGLQKMTKVDLEAFAHRSDSYDVMSPTCEDRVRLFVTFTSLKRLHLDMTMKLEQVLSILKSADFSRLEHLTLRSEGYHSTKVDKMLDCLQRATELKTITLLRASITDEQRTHMAAKGITLRSYQ